MPKGVPLKLFMPMTTKVLCVDDDANILAGFQRTLRKRFTLDTALGGREALELMQKNGPYAVVVADMNMPGMNGIEFLRQARRLAPDTVRFMLTGNADQRTAIEAVNQGQIFQFLTKPCSPEMLAQALDNGIRQYRLVTAERELLENTLNGSIKMLTEVLSMADPESFGVGRKLREYVRAFAESWNVEQTWELELAAMLARLGFVTVPPVVLQKYRSGFGLSGPEKDIIQRVPEVGARLLANIPRLEGVARIVRFHQKNFDGTGVPVGATAGEDIPVGARILKVLSDLVDLEQRGMTRFKALEHMRTRQGWYDPKVLDAAFVCFDIYLPESAAGEGSTDALTLDELRIGQILAVQVETTDGMVIAGAGTQITQMVLEKLKNFAQLGSIKEPILVRKPNVAAAA